jgi:hypothetical protein
VSAPGPTPAPGPGARRGDRRLLVTALAVVVLIGIVTGLVTARETAAPMPLDADSPAPAGALALAEAAARLGWRSERAELPLPATRPGTTYLAVRAYHGVRDDDAGRLLAAVRAGAGLVVDVRAAGDPLTDSLGLALVSDGLWTLDNRRTGQRVGVADALGRPTCTPRLTDPSDGTEVANFTLVDSGHAATNVPGRRLFVDAWRLPADSAGPGARPPRPARSPRGRGDSAVVVRAETTLVAPGRRSQAPVAAGAVWAPVMVGFPLGQGRVVAVADAALLTNSALRTCWAAAGPVALQMLAWVAPAPVGGRGRGTLVFLQGRRDVADGGGPSVLGAVRRALTEVPAGRALAQALGAALVLLAALGARALPPLPAARIERRSPREHVGALAGAYRQARATRLVARRLARGLRRRHGGTTGRAAGDAARRPVAAPADEAAFLASVAARHPALASDAEQLAAATRTPVPPAALPAVGAAAARIDAALAAARRGG